MISAADQSRLKNDRVGETPWRTKKERAEMKVSFLKNSTIQRGGMAKPGQA